MIASRYTYAASLQSTNRIREVATKELYDRVKLAESSGLGIVKGVLGGIAGGALVRAPGRLTTGAAAMPGRAKGVYNESLKNVPPRTTGGPTPTP